MYNTAKVLSIIQYITDPASWSYRTSGSRNRCKFSYKWKCTGGAACIRIVVGVAYNRHSIHTNICVVGWVKFCVTAGILGLPNFWCLLAAIRYFEIACIYRTSKYYPKPFSERTLQVNIHKHLELMNALLRIWMCWYVSYMCFHTNISCTMSKNVVYLIILHIYCQWAVQYHFKTIFCCLKCRHFNKFKTFAPW